MNKQKDSKNYNDQISLLKQQLPEWQNIQTKNIKFERLSGLTNLTYRVKDVTKERDSLIFKEFSQVEGLIGREYENQILIKASEKELGPKCYFANEDYRVEEEITNFHHPTNKELENPQLFTKILKKLAEFHQIKVQNIQNKTVFINYILSQEFINRAIKGINSKKFTPEEQTIVNKIMSYFQQQKMTLLRKLLLPKYNPNNKEEKDKVIKLCHNDLNPLNIMITKQQIYLIDFQYARYNHIAYDIANFINESSIDYNKEIEPYFEFLDELLPSRKQVEEIADQYLSFSNEKGTVSEEMVKGLADDIEKCMGLCNFYWAVWSPMTKNPQISFDYIEHGRKRLERFESVLERLQSQRRESVSSNGSNEDKNQ